MREIIFKARRLDNGEWVFGDLNHFSDGRAAIADSEQDWFLVDPETVCQYTGLNDNNGKRIFENDRILCCAHGTYVPGVVLFGNNGDRRLERNQGFYVRWNDDTSCLRRALGFWTTERRVVVISNIHETRC